MTNYPKQRAGLDRSQIEEIKQRIHIEDVVKRYVKLKPVGKNLFGLCPFHQEDTPSFSVNPEIGIFKCYGCNEGGDVFEFLQKVENLEFYEVLKQLAKEAGVELKVRKTSPKLAKKMARIQQAYELSEKYYNYVLTKHKLGKKGRDYAQKRKLGAKAVEHYKIGYAPSTKSRQALVKFLKKEGFKDEELLEFGLAASRGRDLHDKFFDRLMFPIYDISGNPIAFSGRALEKSDKRPKYLNSPETIIFKKSNNLFGLFQAKQHIRKEDLAILVEGQTDVISSWQIGIANVIAPLGTGVSEPQLSRLQRFTKNLAIAFDSDSAGEAASMRTTTIAYKLGFNVTAIEIPYGNDADECIRHKPELWKKAVKNSIPACSYYVKRITERENPSTLPGKQNLLKKIIPILSAMSDKVTQNHHIQEIHTVTDIPVEVIKESIEKSYSGKVVTPEIEEETDQEFTLSSENYLLSLILQFPDSLTWAAEKIPFEDISSSKIKATLEVVLEEFKKTEALSISKVVQSLPQDTHELCEDLLLRPIWSTEPTQDQISSEITDAIHRIREAKVRSEIAELRKELALAEQRDETKEANEKLNQINNKLKELDALSEDAKKA